MNDQDLMHGIDWQGEDVVGWLASEKANGVCLAWDGAALWTRSGRHITTPDWFKAALPRGQRIIGELWAGRGRFQDSRNATNHGRWNQDLRLLAFDALDAAGTWAQRMATIERNAIVRPVDFRPIETNADLLAMFRAIVSNKGEGVMLRNPHFAGYHAGRTGNIVKITSASQFSHTQRQEAA